MVNSAISSQKKTILDLESPARSAPPKPPGGGICDGDLPEFEDAIRHFVKNLLRQLGI